MKFLDHVPLVSICSRCIHLDECGREIIHALNTIFSERLLELDVEETKVLLVVTECRRYVSVT